MTTTVQFVSLVGFTVTEHYQAILLLGLAFAVASAYQFLYGNRPNNHLPTIDAHLSLPERTTKWLRDARSVLHEGYTKYPGQPWVAHTADGHVVVAPHSMLDELRKLPDTDLSSVEGLEERVAARYSLIHVYSPIRLQVIKGELNPKLGNIAILASGPFIDVSAASLMPEIVDEVETALNIEMPQESGWNAVNANDMLLRVVAKVSSRIFIGPEYCRNDEWLDIAINYTVSAFGTAHAIKKYPPLIRPLIYRFLPEYRATARFQERGKALIVPMVKERLRRENEAAADGRRYEKPNDLMQWLLDAASDAQKGDEDFMVREQLSMSMAAIHTTTIGVLQVLFELAYRPEYIQPLREEMHSVLARHDGQFTKSALEQMKKLDSFMKETHRHNPVGDATFSRKVLRDLTLSNGTSIRAGSMINIPSFAISMDARFQDDAAAFKGFRWAQLREQLRGADAGREQYVSLSNHAMQFGYGRHACPGRFFAANEIKVILANLLLRYDVKMPAGVECRYENKLWDSSIQPDRTKKLLFQNLGK